MAFNTIDQRMKRWGQAKIERELKIEKLKEKRMKTSHKFKIEELELRKEIALIYRSKKGVKNMEKKIKKIKVRSLK